GVLVGLFALMVACGALVGTKDSSKTTVSPQAAPASSSAPVPTTDPPSPSPSPTPTVVAVDRPARTACTANVQAAALRKAGWAAKADAKDVEAEDAAAESEVPAFLSLRSVDSERIPAKLGGWCARHLPTVKAAPVARKPTAKPKPKPAPKPDTDPRFGTCREANAAGYGNYRRGVDVEYGWYQDRDHDGVVCET
ncbi:MAG: excalibur calcium-binding domain-containing protein, partial [Streptosporangiaceae bacterium]